MCRFYKKPITKTMYNCFFLNYYTSEQMSCLYELPRGYISENLTIYQGKITRDYEGRFDQTNCTFNVAKSRYIKSCEDKLDAGRLSRLEFLESIAAWKKGNLAIGIINMNSIHAQNDCS